jgi:glutamate/tyrosine decarboxylase-like PLP-dependent enzyme
MDWPAMPRDRLLATLRSHRRHDAPWREGRVWAGVYDPGDETAAVAREAYLEFLGENALYINLYPSLLQLENEVVTRVKWLLRAPEGACGNFTSGGTESILLAVKAARDRARAERGIGAGEIVLARTAHPAFHKAAHLLGMKVVMTEFDADYRADPAAFARALSPATVMLVASAPCYSHGVVDPVPALADLAQRHGLWLHVDGCVGGLYLSLMRLQGLGAEVPPFDLSVEGVSSLSADLHKYGYASKNASVVLYRSKALRRHALYANAHTTGYALVNSTALSSRSGGPIAGAWATLQSLGQEGYAAIVRETMDATKRLRAGVATIPGLRVLGRPAMCMFTVASEAASVFVIEDEMLARGWHLQTQFATPGTPANLHFSVNRSNVRHVDALLADLGASVEAARQAAPIDVQPLLQTVMQAMAAGPGLQIGPLLAQLGGAAEGSPFPARWAPINTLLDALPDAMVDQLLLDYANELYA